VWGAELPGTLQSVPHIDPKLAHDAKLCKVQSYSSQKASTAFSSAGSHPLQCQDQNLISTSFFFLNTDWYQESKQFKIINSALEVGGRIRDRLLLFIAWRHVGLQLVYGKLITAT
jgi:hypothetical protein